jgi:glycosyltransferase involved in cell wall biosynthesis
VRVAFDASVFGTGRGGDETHLASILVGLAQVAGPDDRFPLFVQRRAELPESLAGDPRFPIAGYVSPRGLTRFAVELGLAVSRLKPRPELLVSVTHAPIWSRVPSALMIGDLSFHHHPSMYPPLARSRLRTLVPYQVKRAQMVITPSRFTRQDIIEHYGADPSRVFVVHPATNPAVRPPGEWAEESPALQAWGHQSGAGVPYLLYLGNLHPRKNVVRLIRAFAEARASDPDLASTRLLVVGRHWWGGHEERGAAYYAPPGAVVFLGQVSDEQRDYLLRHALAVAYPSIFEGFGLPILEAMASGAPVLTSNRTAMPAVAGDAAVLVDPFDIEDIAKGIRRILTDADLRAELRERGFEQASKFSITATGNAAIAALEHGRQLRPPGRPSRLGT